MLSDFFRINLPYGIQRNADGGWCAFNREYMPLGFNIDHHSTATSVNHTEAPIYTEYLRITESLLLSLADSPNSIDRDQNGNITRIWLYNDKTNPMNQRIDSKELWNSYFEKLKKLSKLQRKYYRNR